MKKNIITNWLNRSRKLGLANINIVILILLSLIATVTEIFGVGMFLPIFQFMRLEGDINAVVLDSTIWKYLIDVFIFFNIKPTFVFMLLMSFGFFLARQIFIYFGAVYNVAVKQRVTQYLRNKMFSKYLDADTLYHDNTPVGDLVSILTVETSMAVSGIMAPLELIVSFVVLSAYLFVLSLLSWEMTLASIGILLVASRVPRVWINKSADIGRNIVKANISVSNFLVGRIRSPRLVRLSSAQEVEKKEFYKLTKKQRKYSVFASILGARTDAVMDPVVIFLSFLFIYFSYAVLNLNIEVIGLYLVIIMRILPIVKGIMSQWQRIKRLLGSVEITENRIKSMQDAVEKDTGVETVTKINNSFEICNVDYLYQSSKDYSLKEVSIKFEANKMTALVGPSGSGKSTLVDLLPRLRLPNKGGIKVDGVNIDTSSLKSIRGMISYVPQFSQILGNTVREHITYGNPNVTEKGMQEAIFLSGAEDFISHLPKGVDTNLGEDAIKLSGGQRQRLDLARALIRKSSVLILDEPASNLDAESTLTFEQALLNIRKNTDTTIIIVSHSLASISNADCIVVLNQGVVMESGSHRDLICQNGWYAKAWKIQESKT